VKEDRFQGWLDPPLSPLGERQAALVAARLSGRGRSAFLPLPGDAPVGIWHSRLARAARTAALIGELQSGVPLLRSEALLEIGQGAWEGRLNEEVARDDGPRLAGWRRDALAVHAPGGEPLLVAAERVRSGLPEIIEALERSPKSEPWAILVGHGGSLRLTLLTLLGLPYEHYWAFDFAVCSVSVLSISAGRATLTAHNLTDHLEPLLADPTAAAEARSDRTGAL
jgi:broad specificity phosphatase PhoE